MINKEAEQVVFTIDTLDPESLKESFNVRKLELEKISWDTTIFKLNVDLDVSNVKYNNVWGDFNGLQVLQILYFIKEKVVNLVLYYNINNYRDSYNWTQKFLNIILHTISGYNKLEYLKIILPESYHCSVYYSCIHLAVIPKLKTLDLVDCSLNMFPWITAKMMLDMLTNFFEKICAQSKFTLTQVFFPSFFEKVLIISDDHKFFNVIQKVLKANKNLMIISPLSLLFSIQLKSIIITYDRPGILKILYDNYQHNLKNIEQIKKIETHTREISKLLQEKEQENEKILAEVIQFLPHIHSIPPENLYWLERFLREEINEMQHILACLRALKETDIEKKYLYQTLHNVISGLTTYQYKELDPNANSLTDFIIVPQEELGSLSKETLIKTLIKMNEEFNLCYDQDLRVMFSECIAGYLDPVGGGCGTGEEFRKYLSRDGWTKNTNISLLLYFISEIKEENKIKKIMEIIVPEEQDRTDIYIKQLEEYNKILFDSRNKPLLKG